MKYWLFYVVFLGLLLSCGSRKVETDISNQSSEVKQLEQIKSDINQSEENKSIKSEENKKDITNQKTTKTTTTEFGSDGKPTKQTTTETNETNTDKSTNKKKETLIINKRHLIHSVANRDITKTLAIKEKNKKSESNNFYLYASILIAVLLLGWFIAKKFPNINLKNVS